MAQTFYPFVGEGQTDSKDLPDMVENPARIAVFDDPSAAPRVVVVQPKDVRSYLEEVTATVTKLAKEQGGSISFTVIREIVENLVHAYFKEPTISILDGGNTIRFSDQGPGIKEKDKALEYGTTSATDQMKRYIRGVGSGLPYAMQYMHDHGGDLTIEDNISGGAIVTISLPSEDEDEVAAPTVGQQGDTVFNTPAPGSTALGAMQTGATPHSAVQQPTMAAGYQQPQAWQQPAGAGEQGPAYVQTPQGWMYVWPQQAAGAGATQDAPAPAQYAQGPQAMGYLQPQNAQMTGAASMQPAQPLPSGGYDPSHMAPQMPATGMPVMAPNQQNGYSQPAWAQATGTTQPGGYQQPQGAPVMQGPATPQVMGVAQPAMQQPAAQVPGAWAPDVTVNERGRAAVAYLAQHESVGPTELTQLYGSSMSTWTRELKRLEDQGLVRRVGQKRFLTDLGRSFAMTLIQQG